jgi:plastocyanin
MRKILVLAGFCVAVAGALGTISVVGGLVHANSPRSIEKHQKFSDVFLAIKPGDEVTFLNRDGKTHHIVSQTPGYDLDTGELQPGASKDIVFNRKGIIDLVCSLHPEMKTTIYVRTSPKQPEAVPGAADIEPSVPHTTIDLLSAS